MDAEGEQEKLLIAKLPECSWFGDFQILLDLKSSFQLEAGKVSKKMLTEGSKFVQVYKVRAKTLIDLCMDYPLFRRFLLLRATQRRSHFLKNLNELRNIKELKRKRDMCRKDDSELNDEFESDDDSDLNELTDSQLEKRLKKSVKNLINKQFYEYQKATSDKNHDPSSLRSRVQMVQAGFKQLKEEKDVKIDTN